MSSTKKPPSAQVGGNRISARKEQPPAGCGWRPGLTSSGQLCALGAVFAAAAAAALAIDLPLARWWAAGHLPGELRRLVNCSEGFGYSLGVLIILLLVWQLAPRQRRRLPRMALMSLGAGMVASLIKLLVERTRPRAFDLSSGRVWDTFAGWLPGTSVGSSGQSFPSAHTATAVGLAIALGWAFPKARWTFALVALLVACQRMQERAHFASDVLAGAAIGCFVAALCIRWRGLDPVFDSREMGNEA